jgi:hypothetical protein
MHLKVASVNGSSEGLLSDALMSSF